jgi:hypothetical protein
VLTLGSKHVLLTNSYIFQITEVLLRENYVYIFDPDNLEKGTPLHFKPSAF